MLVKCFAVLLLNSHNEQFNPHGEYHSFYLYLILIIGHSPLPEVTSKAIYTNCLHQVWTNVFCHFSSSSLIFVVTLSINKLHPASAHLLDVEIFSKIKLARSPFHT